MAYAYPISEGSNTIKFHDKDFDSSKEYQIQLVPVTFCLPSQTIELDGVFFCEENVEIDFQLPCLPSGPYHLKIYDVLEPNTILYNLKSNYS